MAPIRRYLRITKHSVLEVRIYLDRPADADAWLLKRSDPALPRVIQAIRPLVLPKLREENERGKGKGSAKAKKKGVKDVVIEDDFEVSIFLTELSSRHSVLTKQKVLRDKTRIRSNSGKLTGWLTTGTSERPVIIGDGAEEPITIPEEEDDDLINLADIPEADVQEKQTERPRRVKRGRALADQEESSKGTDSEDGSDLFVSEPSTKRGKAPKQQRDSNEEDEFGGPQDDKKKLNLNTTYEGFSIYGRILCLVVKRRGVRLPVQGTQLENWVSTQATVEYGEDDEDAN